MFGSLQLAQTNYYNVPTSIGNVDTRLLLEMKGGHIRHLYHSKHCKFSLFMLEILLNVWEVIRSFGNIKYIHYDD